MILLVAEKPDQAMMIAMSLGGSLVQGIAMTQDDLQKPSRMQAIKKERKKGYLDGTLPDGTPYRIRFGRGHSLRLANVKEYGVDDRWWGPTYPFAPTTWRYEPRDAETETLLKAIVQEMEDPKTTEIVNAMDRDREGEGIFWEIVDYGAQERPLFEKSLKKVTRLWLGDLEEATIREAFAKRQSGYLALYQGLRYAQKLRSKIDWLFGINLTVGATLALSQGKEDGVYSVGRVQAPTLWMVVTREKEIASFSAKKSVVCQVDVEDDAGQTFTATLLDDLGKERIFADEGAAKAFFPEEALRLPTMQVQQRTMEKKAIAPPLLYDLTSLQVFLFKRHRHTAKESLDALQALYDRGYVSYPRTDATTVPKAMASVLPDRTTVALGWMDSLHEAHRVEPLSVLHPRMARLLADDDDDASHYGLLVTNVPVTASLLTNPIEVHIYDAIARRVLSSLSQACQEEKETTLFTWEGLTFRTVRKNIAEQGWRNVEGILAKSDSLLALTKGQNVTIKAVHYVLRETKPPSRYHEGTLLEAMKKAGQFVVEASSKKALKEVDGIGTEATRTNILTRLKDVGYLEEDSKMLLRPSEKAMRTIENVQQWWPLFVSPAWTASLEGQLKELEKKDRHWREESETLMDAMTKEMQALMKAIPARVAKPSSPGSLCPACHQPSLQKRKTFLRCTDCSFSLSKTLLGVTLPDAEIEKLLQGKKTKAFLFHSEKGKDFRAKLSLDRGKLLFEFVKPTQKKR